MATFMCFYLDSLRKASNFRPFSKLPTTNYCSHPEVTKEGTVRGKNQGDYLAYSFIN